MMKDSTSATILQNPLVGDTAVYFEKPAPKEVPTTAIEAIESCAKAIKVNVDINYNYRRKLWVIKSAGQRICEREFNDAAIAFCEIVLAIFSTKEEQISRESINKL